VSVSLQKSGEHGLSLIVGCDHCGREASWITDPPWAAGPDPVTWPDGRGDLVLFQRAQAAGWSVEPPRCPECQLSSRNGPSVQ
jgi:hypothetical protein